MAIKTNWTDAPAPTPDAGGSGSIQRGSDPNADGNPGPAGLKPLWGEAPAPAQSGEESANSVSGLPPQPQRWEPSDNPPGPPDLTDRNPGTIDQR